MDMCQQICIFDMIVTRKKNTSKLQTIWVYFLFFSFRIISTDTAGKYLLFFSRNVKNIFCSNFSKITAGKPQRPPLRRNCFCPQACGSISWCSPFKIYTTFPAEAERCVRGQGQRAVEASRGWWTRRTWPWKSPPGGPVEGQRGVGPAHKACLVWDKRRAPGGPYGTIFTIRASLFSLGLRAGACQESSMLAGL